MDEDCRGDVEEHDSSSSVEDVPQRAAPQTDRRGEKYDDCGCSGRSAPENRGHYRRVEHRGERSWGEHNLPVHSGNDLGGGPLLLGTSETTSIKKKKCFGFLLSGFVQDCEYVIHEGEIPQDPGIVEPCRESMFVLIERSWFLWNQELI